MNPVEEAGLRQALAQREAKLAQLLLDPHASRQDVDAARRAVERLRSELGGK